MILTLLLLSSSLTAAQPAPLPTVPSVDLQRYAGSWHEIARFPNSFQRGCELAVATYTLLADGSVEVRNSCRTPGGGTRSVVGKARVDDAATHARLKVSFVPAWLRWTGIGWGDYWIIDLAPDYSHAVVSEPGRKYLWILNREPSMRKETYEKILSRLRELGFDVGRLMPSGPGTLKEQSEGRG